jgi:hypothetical protein
MSLVVDATDSPALSNLASTRRLISSSNRRALGPPPEPSRSGRVFGFLSQDLLGPPSVLLVVHRHGQLFPQVVERCAAVVDGLGEHRPRYGPDATAVPPCPTPTHHRRRPNRSPSGPGRGADGWTGCSPSERPDHHLHRERHPGRGEPHDHPCLLTDRSRDRAAAGQSSGPGSSPGDESWPSRCAFRDLPQSICPRPRLMVCRAVSDRPGWSGHPLSNRAWRPLDDL